MGWAGKRRFVIISILVAAVATILALILIPTFYQSPSCMDLTQNQGEQGIDCGGPCTYLCNERQQAPVVLFTEEVFPTENRADVVAYVSNPNIDAAALNVPYTVTLYASDRTILKQTSGTFNLPPQRSTPFFFPAFFTGNVQNVNAFLTVDESAIQWVRFTDALRIPKVLNPELGGSENAPRVTATLTNESTMPFEDVSVIAIVYDSGGNVLGASRTLLPAIPGQGSTEAVFTWTRPFSGTVGRIEVTPLPEFNP